MELNNEKKVLSSEDITKYNEKMEKKGVVYVGRVPPFMKPQKVRHLLSQYGNVERIFLMPEDSTQRKNRVKSGGNRKINYIEGWIEFEDKRVAKKVAKCLHLKKISQKKGNHYYDDMWCLKYLKGFKWDHLTEKMAYEKQIRKKKLQLEIAQSKRENERYLERVDQSKTISFIEKKNKRKLELNENIQDNALDNERKQIEKIRRTFKQKLPITNKKVENEIILKYFETK